MSLASAPVGPGSLWTWWPAVLALLCYAVAMLPSARLPGRVPNVALMVGWMFQGLALVYDVAGVGQEGVGARFGFAPALSAILWLVMAVHHVESRLLPLPAVRRVMASSASIVVLLAALYPGVMRPQAGSAWMPLHWMLGIASYGLFGAAVVHGMLLDAAERRIRQKVVRPGAATGAFGLPLLRLERLTFRFVDAGFVVLSLALLLGLATEAQQPGSFRWDHKTVFSLLGWATFAGLIAGRHAWGWRGRRATRWLYAGALLLLLAYVGSRFVLEVLLQRAA